MFKPVDPHPNFSKLEEEILKFWEKEKIFEKSLEKTTPSSSPPVRGANRGRKSGGVFTFYDGPPFATGLPHYGHILASTIKDVIPRYQTMRGRFVRRRWGWDCHGLPIEEIVERKLKISGKKEIEKIGINKFNETCRSMVLQYVAEWGKLVKRIARWVEFENSYKTMDRDYMESVWWAFKEIYKKGLVYEGRKVLLYCPRCETPVSKFEVAMDNSYKDVTEEAVTVKFPAKGGSALGGKIPNDKPTYLLAWTTTPWTLPGNTQLYVSKNIDYVVVEVGRENYIVARDLVGSVIPGLRPRNPESSGSRLGGRDDKDERIVAEVKGQELVGLTYDPLFDIPEIKSSASYKVTAADFVSTEEGTGIVHSAVVHGEEDYEMGLKQGLPVVPLLDEKGQYNNRAPEFLRGQYFKSAEKDIKSDLEKRGLIFDRRNHTHSYPHCWRCGTLLFYNAIPAWFIKISNIKSQILKSNKEEINWYPEHLKFGRYAKSVESAPDWNISRNRYWGNPIPVWRCKKCGKDTVVGSIEELQGKAINFDVILSPPRADEESQKRSFASAQDDRLIDLHRPYIDEVLLKCEHCGGESKRITEIFDSWFEAASMPFASVHYPFTPPLSPPHEGGRRGGVENEKFIFPAQFVAEYIAQTRAWFYVMHVMSLILFERAPFENVVTTGTILNEKGDKLSKSRKNFPDPWEILNKYGADSLRFYLMNSVVMQADNLFFSERDLQIVYRKVILILWNVYNYFVTYVPPHLSSPTRGEELKEGGKILDLWILLRLQELTNHVTEYLDNYDTVRATREIEGFVNDLSTWYLRRSRGREDEDFFASLHHCLIALCKVMAPFTPFLAEAIYQNLTTKPLSQPLPSQGERGVSLSLQRGGIKGGVDSVHLADWPKVKKLTKKQQDLLKQMSEIRKIVEEVHALRAKAGIKLRQPLAKLTIPKRPINGHATAEKRKGSSPIHRQLFDILKDEVNVLDIKFGKKLELDTKITPELKIAGLARELERQIQQLRKESGLKIGEMVDLSYETKSDMLKKAIKKVDKKKIYVKEVRPLLPALPAGRQLPPLPRGKAGTPGEEGKWEKEIEVEGEKVLIRLKKLTF